MKVGEAMPVVIGGCRLKVRREEDGYVTCVPLTGQFVWLNETGFAIVTLLGEERTDGEIVDALAARYPLPAPFWREAVDAFLIWLGKAGILPGGEATGDGGRG